MEFPVLIENEQQFNRMVCSIASEAAIQTADRILLNLGLIKPEMTRAQCYKIAGRTRVDNAMKNRKLKFSIKDEKVLIRREDFNKWHNKK